MAGDSIGKIFKVTNWGESHGQALGVVIEGCPPKIKIDPKTIQEDLDRRRPGQSDITTPRKEKDKVEILSGIIDEKSTGAPISLIIYNEDKKSKDYRKLKEVFRPSHADYTYFMKYGIRDPYGGGRSSARVTAGMVAAGSIAKSILREKLKIEIIAFVKSIKNLEFTGEREKVTFQKIEANKVRCPDQKLAKKMENLILETMKKGDSLGGVIECLIKNPPAGLGEPIFDKLEADLAKAMLSINAVKGFEIGSGFEGTKLLGSEHNDSFTIKNKKVMTTSNFSGGVQGGISNGMPIYFTVGFKPTSTILQKQKSVNRELKNIDFTAVGRHDPCVVPRAVPIVEAMAALVLIDHSLRFQKI